VKPGSRSDSAAGPEQEPRMRAVSQRIARMGLTVSYG
jgi:hypothetical protein